MNKNDTNEVIESLKTFRQDLYDSFLGRADANMDLLDSLSANQIARSVVELSLNEPFQREYSSVFDAVQREAQREARKIRTMIISAHIPAPVQRPFWLRRPYDVAWRNWSLNRTPRTVGSGLPVVAARWPPIFNLYQENNIIIQK